MTKRILAFLISFCFIFEQTGFAQLAIPMGIPGYLSLLAPVGDKFRPIHLRAITLDSNNGNYELVLDKGDVKETNPGQKEESAKKLFEYFQIGLALPNKYFWVNLRPDSPDEVIEPLLAKTDLGKVMLEADLQLKKDLASATSPQTPEGQLYWNKLYAKASELYRQQDIQIPTLTRPWIVPGEIIIRSSQTGAFIYKSTLKVMLEQDYIKNSPAYNFSDPRQKELNGYSSQLIRELIIPKLTREVNSSRLYAPLRQVYYSLILAQWFKTKSQVKNIDSQDLSGLTSKTGWSKDTYYQAYRKSFQKGEYNRQEQVSSASGLSIRQYFSGGITMMNKPVGEWIVIPEETKEAIAGFFAANQEFFERTIINHRTGDVIDLPAGPVLTPGGQAQPKVQRLAFDGGTVSSEELKEMLLERLEALHAALGTKMPEYGDMSNNELYSTALALKRQLESSVAELMRENNFISFLPNPQALTIEELQFLREDLLNAHLQDVISSKISMVESGLLSRLTNSRMGLLSRLGQSLPRALKIIPAVAFTCGLLAPAYFALPGSFDDLLHVKLGDVYEQPGNYPNVPLYDISPGDVNGYYLAELSPEEAGQVPLSLTVYSNSSPSYSLSTLQYNTDMVFADVFDSPGQLKQYLINRSQKELSRIEFVGDPLGLKLKSDTKYVILPKKPAIDQYRENILNKYGFTFSAAEYIRSHSDVVFEVFLKDCGGYYNPKNQEVHLEGLSDEVAIHEFAHSLHIGQNLTISAGSLEEYKKLNAENQQLKRDFMKALVRLAKADPELNPEYAPAIREAHNYVFTPWRNDVPDIEKASWDNIDNWTDKEWEEVSSSMYVESYASLMSFTSGEYKSGPRKLPQFMWRFYEPFFTGKIKTTPYYLARQEETDLAVLLSQRLAYVSDLGRKSKSLSVYTAAYEKNYGHPYEQDLALYQSRFEERHPGANPGNLIRAVYYDSQDPDPLFTDKRNIALSDILELQDYMKFMQSNLGSLNRRISEVSSGKEITDNAQEATPYFMSELSPGKFLLKEEDVYGQAKGPLLLFVSGEAMKALGDTLQAYHVTVRQSSNLNVIAVVNTDNFNNSTELFNYIIDKGNGRQIGFIGDQSKLFPELAKSENLTYEELGAVMACRDKINSLAKEYKGNAAQDYGRYRQVWDERYGIAVKINNMGSEGNVDPVIKASLVSQDDKLRREQQGLAAKPVLGDIIKEAARFDELLLNSDESGAATRYTLSGHDRADLFPAVFARSRIEGYLNDSFQADMSILPLYKVIDTKNSERFDVLTDEEIAQHPAESDGGIDPGNKILYLPEEIKKYDRSQSSEILRTFFSFENFMNEALFNPDWGYYSSGKVQIKQDLLDEGHFRTYPESMSPYFSQLIGEQMFNIWKQMKDNGLIKPGEKFQIIEFGAGYGTLAYDMLSFLTRQPKIYAEDSDWKEFISQLQYVIGEKSKYLREEKQRPRLAVFGDKVEIRDADARNPEDFARSGFKGVIVSNELPDAFGVERARIDRRFIKDGYFEVCVAVPTISQDVLFQLGLPQEKIDDLSRASKEYSRSFGLSAKTNIVYLSAESYKELVKLLEGPQGKGLREQFEQGLRFKEIFVDGSLVPQVQDYISRNRAILIHRLEKNARPFVIPVNSASGDYIRSVAKILNAKDSAGYVLTIDYGGNSHRVIGGELPEKLSVRCYSEGVRRSTDYYVYAGYKDMTSSVDATYLHQVGKENDLETVVFGKQGILLDYAKDKLTYKLMRERNPLKTDGFLGHSGFFMLLQASGNILPGQRYNYPYYTTEWRREQGAALEPDEMLFVKNAPETFTSAAFLEKLDEIGVNDPEGFAKGALRVWAKYEYELTNIISAHFWNDPELAGKIIDALDEFGLLKKGLEGSSEKQDGGAKEEIRKLVYGQEYPVPKAISEKIYLWKGEKYQNMNSQDREIAVAKDAEAMWGLYSLIWKDDLKNNENIKADKIAEFKKLLTGGSAELLWIFEPVPGQIKGYLTVTEKEDYVTITSGAVAAEYQKNKVGTTLWLAMMEFMGGKGTRRFETNTVGEGSERIVQNLGWKHDEMGGPFQYYFEPDSRDGGDPEKAKDLEIKARVKTEAKEFQNALDLWLEAQATYAGMPNEAGEFRCQLRIIELEIKLNKLQEADNDLRAATQFIGESRDSQWRERWERQLESLWDDLGHRLLTANKYQEGIFFLKLLADYKHNNGEIAAAARIWELIGDIYVTNQQNEPGFWAYFAAKKAYQEVHDFAGVQRCVGRRIPLSGEVYQLQAARKKTKPALIRTSPILPLQPESAVKPEIIPEKAPLPAGPVMAEKSKPIEELPLREVMVKRGFIVVNKDGVVDLTSKGVEYLKENKVRVPDYLQAEPGRGQRGRPRSLDEKEVINFLRNVLKEMLDRQKPPVKDRALLKGFIDEEGELTDYGIRELMRNSNNVLSKDMKMGIRILPGRPPKIDDDVLEFLKDLALQESEENGIENQEVNPPQESSGDSVVSPQNKKAEKMKRKARRAAAFFDQQEIPITKLLPENEPKIRDNIIRMLETKKIIRDSGNAINPADIFDLISALYEFMHIRFDPAEIEPLVKELLRDPGHTALSSYFVPSDGSEVTKEQETKIDPIDQLAISLGLGKPNGLKHDGGAARQDGGGKDAPGGIDFRQLPVSGQTLITPVFMPQLQQLAANSKMKDLDQEWSRIRGEMLSPEMPYSQIKEYIAVCLCRTDCRQKLGQAVSCIIDILRMEEDQALSTNQELKDILKYIS